MKRVTLGQYYPADSVLHRMDPRAKLIVAILYIVCTFLCQSAVSYGVLLVSAFALILLGRIPLRIVMRSVKPIIFVLLFTVIINLFWTQGEGEPLVSFWIVHIYLSGIYHAVFMAERIFVLIIGSCMFLTYTTTPIALTDAIEQLLYPLRRLHLPVHEFAMMMTIALRFIPTLMDETDKIVSAQKARGADFATGSLVRRAKALVPVLVPLFVSAFRRAEELATAMECRCYHGGDGRTRMNVLKFRVLDVVSIGVIVLFGAGLVCLNAFGVR